MPEGFVVSNDNGVFVCNIPNLMTAFHTIRMKTRHNESIWLRQVPDALMTDF